MSYSLPCSISSINHKKLHCTVLHDPETSVVNSSPHDKMTAITQTTFSNAFNSNRSIWISSKTSLKFVPKGPINSIPALIQIMASRRPGDRPLSEPMLTQFTDAYMRHSGGDELNLTDRKTRISTFHSQWRGCWWYSDASNDFHEQWFWYILSEIHQRGFRTKRLNHLLTYARTIDSETTQWNS